MSIGIALYPDDGRDFESLLQCADTAMYRAKAEGGNAFRFYDAQMQAEASDRLRMRICLSHAIEREELQLHYQPQIDLETGAVCGAEALLRWESPELGSVPPALLRARHRVHASGTKPRRIMRSYGVGPALRGMPSGFAALSSEELVERVARLCEVPFPKMDTGNSRSSNPRVAPPRFMRRLVHCSDGPPLWSVCSETVLAPDSHSVSTRILSRFRYSLSRCQMVASNARLSSAGPRGSVSKTERPRGLKSLAE